MKTCSKCLLEKPLAEFSKNPLGKLGVRADCRLCVKAYDGARYALAADQRRQEARDKRAANPVRSRGYVSAYYRRNADQIRAKARAKYDPKHGADRARSYRQRFPEKHLAEVVARDAAKLKATPRWADKDKILSFYVEARKLSIATGIKHHVDHIYPLRSKLVCGLHNEFNLRVLPAYENQKKYNSMPEANI